MVRSAGILPNRRLFINFLVDITPFCDCAEFAPEFISPDIEVLASTDIVAIDQATLELIGPGAFGDDPAIQIRRAESLGFGTREYELIRL